MIRFTSARPKIAIFRALQLGEMLCAIPAIKALRVAYPHAEIVLLGLPWAVSFVERFHHYIDRFIHFPGYPGLPEQSYSEEDWVEFQRQMQKEQFDLILQMHNNGTIVNDMLQLVSAKQVAGFHCDAAYMPYPFFLDYPSQGSEVNRHVLLMKHLAVPIEDFEMEYPVFPKEEKEFEELGLLLTPRTYVCISPALGSNWRQWPPEHFASLADQAMENGLSVVFIGEKEEQTITHLITRSMQHTALDLTGQTSLGTIALLIKNAALLVSNSLGVSHIAMAMKTPSMVICLDGEPERWSPMNHKNHKTIDWIKSQDYGKVALHMFELLCYLKDDLEPELKHT